MFLRSLAIVLALAGPALATNVTRVWTSSGANVNHLTCAANDSLDASLCPSVPWQVATSAPSCSQEGLAYWHSTNDRLGVCDGSSFVEFYSGAHTTDTGPSPDCSGSLTYQDGEGNCDSYTLSGNTAELATVSSKTSGKCAEWDANGNLVADGDACNTGSGGGTPGGSDTQVQFNDGGSSFGGDASFRYSKTGDRVILGDGDYGAGALSLYDGTFGEAIGTSVYVGTTAAQSGQWTAAHARGTIGAEDALDDGDRVGVFGYVGHSGSGFVDSCQMRALASGDFTGSNSGSDWRLSCPVDGATAQTVRLLISADGTSVWSADGTNGVGMSNAGALAAAGSGSIVATTAAALASNPTDCGANEFANTIAENGNLSCAQPDHGSLAGLTDDDHSQYALLLGRSGGQELNGGNGSGEDLTLESTDHSTKGRVEILDGADFGENFDGDTLTANNTFYSFLDAAEIDASGPATNHYAMRVAPIIHLGQVGVIGQSWQVLRAEMYFDMDDATGSHVFGISPWLFANQNEYHRSVDTTFPYAGQTFRDQATLSNDHASAWSISSHITGISAPILKTTVNGNPTLTASVGYQVNPAFQCNNASATCTITTQRDFYSATSTVGGSSSGTEAITTKYSFVAEADTRATTHYGFWNEALYVAKPTSTVPGAGFTIAVNAEYMELDPTSSRTSDGTTAVSDGVEGQRVTFANVDAGALTVTFQDAANIRLSGSADYVMGPTDTLSLIFDGAEWLETGRGDN